MIMQTHHLDLINFYYQVGDHVLFDLQTTKLEIHDSAKIGIIGLNGAGKTTLLSLIAKVKKLQGNSQILLNNSHLQYRDSAFMLQIPEEHNDNRTVYQEIANYLSYRGSNIDHNYLNELYISFSILPDFLYKNLSFGQKRLVSFLSCILYKPKVLILDEPTMGIHVDKSNLILEHIKQYPGLVICSSNDLADLKDSCNLISYIRDKSLTKPEPNPNLLTFTK